MDWVTVTDSNGEPRRINMKNVTSYGPIPPMSPFKDGCETLIWFIGGGNVPIKESALVLDEAVYHQDLGRVIVG